MISVNQPTMPVLDGSGKLLDKNKDTDSGKLKKDSIVFSVKKAALFKSGFLSFKFNEDYSAFVINSFSVITLVN